MNVGCEAPGDSALQRLLTSTSVGFRVPRLMSLDAGANFGIKSASLGVVSRRHLSFMAYLRLDFSSDKRTMKDDL